MIRKAFPVYKFLKRDFAESLLRKGEVRIGTMNEYRGYEENSEINDFEEGKFSQTTVVGEEGLIAKSNRDLPGTFRRSFGMDARRQVNATFYNVTVIINKDLPDVYTYCTNVKPDKKVMESFGYDACVEIYPIPIFWNLILRELVLLGKLDSRVPFLSPIEYPLGKECIYFGRNLITKNFHNGHFFKGVKYAHQREYRMIGWQFDHEVKLEPIILQIPELKKYCRLVRI